MLAASGGVAAGGSLIVSRPAVADSGSEACRFDFGGTPTASFTATSSVIGDFIDIEMTGVGGTCPCGGGATTLYSFAIARPNTALSTGGWITSPTASANFVDLWPLDGGPFTMSAGVQVTCAGAGSPPTTRCRFASQGYNMPGGFFEQVIDSFGLPTNNGNSTLPNLPACTNVAAAQSRSRGGLTPGAGQVPADLEARARAAMESSDPGEPGAPSPEPVATTEETVATTDETGATRPPSATPSASSTTTTPPSSTSSTTTSLPTTTSTPSSPTTSTTGSTTSAPTTTTPSTTTGAPVVGEP